jgi:hypothetical protein
MTVRYNETDDSYSFDIDLGEQISSGHTSIELGLNSIHFVHWEWTGSAWFSGFYKDIRIWNITHIPDHYFDDVSRL